MGMRRGTPTNTHGSSPTTNASVSDSPASLSSFGLYRSSSLERDRAHDKALDGGDLADVAAAALVVVVGADRGGGRRQSSRCLVYRRERVARRGRQRVQALHRGEERAHAGELALAT